MNEEETRNTQNSNDQMKDELMQQIKALNFSVIEIGLYLNTHPNDVRALYLHRRYTNELKNLRDKYQRLYGPLTIYFPCNRWRWIEGPWPSFILEVTTYLQFFSLYNKKIYRKNVKFL